MKLAISHYIHCNCRIVIILLFCFSLPWIVSEWNEDAEEKDQRSTTMSGSSDNENTSLMAEQAKAKKKQPDWSRFGLSREPVKGESDLTRSASEIQDGSYQSLEEGKHNELYREDQVREFLRSWWKKITKIVGKKLFSITSLHKFTWNWEEKKRCIKWLHIQH